MRTGGRGGGFGGMPGGAKGVGGVGGVIVMVVIALLTRGGGGGGGGVGGAGGLNDVFDAGFPAAQTAPAGQGQPVETAADADLRVFVSEVFNDTQDFWATNFSQADEQYQDATLVFFDTPVPSGCGGARAEVGPHYCPPDNTVFIELGFFQQLNRDFDAPGDFAQAYVVAHEMGHHVQNVLGTNEQVRQLQQENPEEANEYSIRLELQADCYAGVWAKTVYDRGLLDEGDIDEGLAAAAGVGDDRIQEKATGRVDREGWTHGSSEQRQRWLREGFDGGRPDACDTFSGDV